MANDFEIGRVVAVDTAQVTVELNPDLKALTRNTYEGAYEVGRINSYVILPVGARRLVAIVTKMVLAEEAEITADRTMVTLPSARRLMKATLIGTIEGEEYTQGVDLFPVLDNPVHMATEADLGVIFDHRKEEKTSNPEEPGFCVMLGESPIFSGYPIKINPDAFFGKHAAIIGSTGSGKSCTIASLIQSILSRSEIRRSHIVVLDTNGEYRSAFRRQRADGTWEDAIPDIRFLYIPSDPGKLADRLVIPYWFLNAEDFVRLFRAAPTIQRPVLLDAVRRARTGTRDAPTWRRLRLDIITELNRIIGHSRSSDRADARAIRKLADGLFDYLADTTQSVALDQLATNYPAVGRERLTGAARSISDIAREGISNEGGQYESYAPIDVGKRNRISAVADPILRDISTLRPGIEAADTSPTADTPAWFDRNQFRDSYLAQAMDREESGRAREHCATLLLRVHRLLEDPRFEFLFGPLYGQWPSPEHSLASFLRDMVGLSSAMSPQPPLSAADVIRSEVLPFYDRQRIGTTGHKVVVVDLSLLASEVLENVTALIGRLVLEFLQRLGESGNETARGSLPVVLVLEEAQNYIREQRFGEEESISRSVFERIAREGRKYGLSLVVASQRPSELSKTVLSQCNSFVVHRLQNPEDLRYFKDIVPGIYGPLLDQLPALAPQTALVLGECVRAPALVRIREARPVPRSRDPKFYRYWVADTPLTPDVEEICRLWEGETEVDNSGGGERKVPGSATGKTDEEE